MTTPQMQPLGYTTDGVPIFPAAVCPPGQAQPVGVLSDGQLVWAVPPGHVPADQPQPFGYLATGQFLYWRFEAPPVPAAPAAPVLPSQPMASPAAFTSSPAPEPTYPPVVSSRSVSPAWSGQQPPPAWKKKRVLVPAGALALIVAIGVSNSGSDKTEITNAGATRTQTSAAGTTANNAPAGKAPVDKAAAAKAAADKVAAAKAASAKEAADKAAADKAAAAAKAAENGPADEQAFVNAVSLGRDGYQSTDNELKQRQFQAQRDAAVRAAVRGLRVTNWVGEIRSIDTNGGGKGVLELGIGDDTKVATWNNAFSDFADNTLIPMNSSMYTTLVDLKEGDRIRFSGTFFSDAEHGLEERSLTLNGQMMTPNFVFRFSSIAPIG